jgi:hypothetical protein
LGKNIATIMLYKKAITFGIRVVIFAGIIAVIIAAAIPVLRKHSPGFNWIFSPTDLYKPLSVSTIDLGKEGQSYQISFENKYPGLHCFAIQVANPRSTTTAYEGDFVLRLEIRHDHKPVLSKLIHGPSDPYGSQKSGFAVLWYRAPLDLPLREPLEAEITVVKADQAFVAKHGMPELVVRKLSDE